MKRAMNVAMFARDPFELVEAERTNLHLPKFGVVRLVSPRLPRVGRGVDHRGRRYGGRSRNHSVVVPLRLSACKVDAGPFSIAQISLGPFDGRPEHQSDWCYSEGFAQPRSSLHGRAALDRDATTKMCGPFLTKQLNRSVRRRRVSAFWPPAMQIGWRYRILWCVFRCGSF